MSDLSAKDKRTTEMQTLNVKGDRDLSVTYSLFLTNASAFRALGTLPPVLDFSNDITYN